MEEKIIKAIQAIIESNEFEEIHANTRNNILVASLQQNLINLGYDLGKTGTLANGVDGDYGELTIEAVEDFKHHASLKLLSTHIEQAVLDGGLNLVEVEELMAEVEELPAQLEENEKIQNLYQKLNRASEIIRQFPKTTTDQEICFSDKLWGHATDKGISLDDIKIQTTFSDIRGEIRDRTIK